MRLTYDQALADTTRALREAYPDRWEAIIDALQRESPVPLTVSGPNAVVLTATLRHEGGPFETADLFDVRHCALLTTDNVMPYDWQSVESFGRCDSPDIAGFMLVEKVNGIEEARHPLGAWLGQKQIARGFDRHVMYELELRRITAGQWDVPPFSLTLALAGFRGRERVMHHRPSAIWPPRAAQTDLADFFTTAAVSSLVRQPGAREAREAKRRRRRAR